MDPNTLKMVFGAATFPPVLITFSAANYYPAGNTSTTIQWTVENSASVSIDQGIGTVASSGSASVSGNAVTRTYILTALGLDGQTSTSSITVAWSSGVDPNCPYIGTRWEWAC